LFFVLYRFLNKELGFSATMEDMDGTSDELCNSILSRFGNSTNEDHQHLCTVIGTMSQELKDQNLPSTPVAYFGATCSSLDRLASEPQQHVHVVQSLLSILHIKSPQEGRVLVQPIASGSAVSVAVGRRCNIWIEMRFPFVEHPRRSQLV